MFVLEIQVDCMESIWNPHGFQATLSKRKNPKKSKKILWPQVHKNYDIMLCQNEVSSKYFSCQQSMTTDVQCMSLTNMQLQTTSSSFYSLYILCQTRLCCEILQHKISWLVWHCWLVQLWHVISMTICTLTTTNGHSNIDFGWFLLKLFQVKQCWCVNIPNEHIHSVIMLKWAWAVQVHCVWMDTFVYWHYKQYLPPSQLNQAGQWTHQEMCQISNDLWWPLSCWNTNCLIV